MPSDKLYFDPNGLYILLTDMGAPDQFHWGFYLAESEDHGRVYHLINNKDTNYGWEYDSHWTDGVPKSKALLLAHKIAVMDPGLHKPMGALLEAVSADLPVTCRVWLKRALHDLDDAGFIALTSPRQWVTSSARWRGRLLTTSYVTVGLSNPAPGVRLRV
ncbi:hypothetical protein ASPCAL11817 [Aspergillus calidoustus]|uniref:Uncharacterized protein n=1 Tax=Aspergillus calidoustus TaxID=454130 RepID=A0A0U5GA82_ASPCI|nr:hypothetical protein ASPCAL11817 [Aspergillus calidoustus]